MDAINHCKPNSNTRIKQKNTRFELQDVTLNTIFNLKRLAEKKLLPQPPIDPFIANNLNLKSELDAENATINLLQSTNETLSLNYAYLSEKCGTRRLA